MLITSSTLGNPSHIPSSAGSSSPTGLPRAEVDHGGQGERTPTPGTLSRLLGFWAFLQMVNSKVEKKRNQVSVFRERGLAWPLGHSPPDGPAGGREAGRSCLAPSPTPGDTDQGAVAGKEEGSNLGQPTEPVSGACWDGVCSSPLLAMLCFGLHLSKTPLSAGYP